MGARGPYIAHFRSGFKNKITGDAIPEKAPPRRLILESSSDVPYTMVKTEKPKFILFAATFVFAAAMALYASGVTRALLWDDGSFIGQNSFVRDCSNLGAALNPVNLFRVLPVSMSARPVVNATLIADACFGGGVAGMHLTNALLHAFNAVLVFFLILTLSGSGLPAFFGALVFALHPAAAEVVNIITFRSHLLGFFFFTAGLIAAVFHAREGRPGQAAAASACYLLAMLSVETAVVLPLAALAAVYFEKGREGFKKILPLMAAMAVPAVFYIWFRTPRTGYAMAGVSSPGVAAPSLLYPKFLFPAAWDETIQVLTLLPWRRIYENPLAGLYTMARVTLDYFMALPLPIHLNTDYNPAVITSAAGGLLPLAADLAVVASAIGLFMRKRLEGLGLFLVLTALLPVMNIWPIYNIKADRYLYLPMAGFSLAAAAVFSRISRAGAAGRLYLTAAACLWLGTLAVFAIARIPEFKDNFSLFSTAVKKDPTVARARLNLAGAYLQAGNYPAAINQTAEAVRLDPENYQLRTRLAFNLSYCGRHSEAMKETDAVLKSHPQEASALYLAGLLRLKSDRRAALGFLRMALKAAPGHRETRLTLFYAEKRNTADLTPEDRNYLITLQEFHRQIGLR